jgi:glycosyltransferase involved in cell wall biosynthesis
MNSFKWYMAHFPESQFLVSSDNIEEYRNRVIGGHAETQVSNVLICGIARNIGKIAPYTFARIEATGRLFNNWHAFIYENDSTDDTKEQLKKWQTENDNVTIRCEDINPPPFTDEQCLARRRCMAYARNQYLEFAREYVKKNRVHYIIIVDTDLEGGWSYHGLLNSIGHAKWDIIGSNGINYFTINGKHGKGYYDTWALRKFGNFTVLPEPHDVIPVYDRGEKMLRVNSCFGGMAIYKPYFLFENFNYTEADCDHPTLHYNLIHKGYDIYVNPSQIVLYTRSCYVC